jgi:iron complex transport system ATP-binding protein
MVELRGIGHRVGDVTILDDVSASFQPGRFNVVLGPNGAGKSTLLRIAAGLLRPTAGEVLYDGARVASIGDERLARRRAMLSQHVELAFPLSVEDVVLMGRYPHYGRVPRAIDREIVRHTLALVEMRTKSSQAYDTLSGGERQKVQLARVLAQIWRDGDVQVPPFGVAQGRRSARDGAEAQVDTARVLFLDEPTSNLDVHYQLWLLDLARDLLAHDCTVVAILHDLNVALEYGEHFLLLNAGRVAVEAERADDITPAIVETVFRVRARRVASSPSDAGYWRFTR